MTKTIRNDIADKHQDLSVCASELLGPIILRWLHSIYEYTSKFPGDDTTILFCSRAGVRIEELYSTFLQKRGFESEIESNLFWVSRFAISKGIFNEERELATSALQREFKHQPIHEFLRRLFKHDIKQLEKIDLEDERLKAQCDSLPAWLNSKQPPVKYVKEYLSECGNAFKNYVHELAGDRKNIILIDSGWGGSTQNMLRKTFPSFNWYGLYFGTSYLDFHDASVSPNAVGLVFEDNSFQPHKAGSCFTRHRHLIEYLLEPRGPSIEEIYGGPLNDQVEASISKIFDGEKQHSKRILFEDVKSYVEAHAADSMISIVNESEKALRELSKAIITPSSDDARLLGSFKRSADFGSTLEVPVLILNANDDPVGKDQRIKESLWPEGQIALEYEGKIANELQLRINGLSDNASYFAPPRFTSKAIEKGFVDNLNSRPKVAIITRTKNRPLLFERAAKSVGLQTFEDYIWVVVNDGGDLEAVKDVIENSVVDRRKILLVSHEKSIGMEAASNAGISASDSEYIVIHDDDDSWEPSFLAETVEEIQNNEFYSGVVTHSRYVSEEIIGGTVKTHDSRPYKNWFYNIDLQEMATGNFFPPIAFLYKRDIWEKIGGYNEQLPVLGDWFFNMEVLLRSDIKVLPKILANYHHRDRGDSKNDIYSNSVIGGRTKHLEYASVARNCLIRRYPENIAISALLVGTAINSIRDQSTLLRSVGGPADSERMMNLFNEFDRLNVITQINNKISLARRLYCNVSLGPLSDKSNWLKISKYLEKSRVVIDNHPTFDAELYLKSNPDVADFCAIDRSMTPYFHYLVYGKLEGRKRTSKVYS